MTISEETAYKNVFSNHLSQMAGTCSACLHDQHFCSQLRDDSVLFAYFKHLLLSFVLNAPQKREEISEIVLFFVCCFCIVFVCFYSCVNPNQCPHSENIPNKICQRIEFIPNCSNCLKSAPARICYRNSKYSMRRELLYIREQNWWFRKNIAIVCCLCNEISKHLIAQFMKCDTLVESHFLSTVWTEQKNTKTPIITSRKEIMTHIAH